ncbi:putative virion structural protein [Xanthomonas phage vB_Xar_IVIA-DoCa5]|uniref:Virion structural protein n=1 Tax=Xanthomonas phage vB_Xar_IVIA-DoCa5 TaxID=2975532 RepID=A0A9X9JMU7_9CAUD|nr:putative virion structural protein [Xanthomonas phage vB_Xar_IVIA-DoCa5]UYA98697.1 putative virion structural protein [Xanthomonas phage vB_Xar_IVIA-DoCa5]
MADVITHAYVGVEYRRVALAEYGVGDMAPPDPDHIVAPIERSPDLGAAPRTDNAPIPALEDEVDGWRMPTFLDDYYYRVHVRPGVIELGNLLSSQTRQVEVWNAHMEGKLLSSVDSIGLDGIDLAEPEPAPTTFASLEARIYTLSISTNGAPVIDGYFEFVFPDEAPDLHVTGRRVVVWPFVPQTRFRESLEWMTDVLRAYSAEQRLALRVAPRQSLQHDYQLTPYQYSRAKAIATQWAHRVYGAPVWAEATRLGDVVSGSTSLDFDTSNADYREDDIVLVWESDEKFVAAETTTVSPGSIGLKLPLDQSYFNAYVMPMRFARTLNGTEFRRDAHDIVLARMNFLVTNNVDLGGDIGLPVYRDVQVMTDRSVVLSDMSERILRAVDVFDNGSGPIAVDQVRAYPERTEMLSMDALDRASAWRMRRWLHSRRGKQRSFWIPSWNPDLIILEDVGSTSSSLTVRPIGYPLYYGVTDIMVELADGTRIFAHVLSGSTDPDGNEVLSLDGPIGTAFAAANVAICCFMKHVRLDADRADIQHSYAGRASTSVAVTEVPEGE